MNPEYLSVAEVAARLGVSADRVRQLDARLAPIRVGTARAYRPEAVEALAGERAATKIGMTARELRARALAR